MAFVLSATLRDPSLAWRLPGPALVALCVATTALWSSQTYLTQQRRAAAMAAGDLARASQAQDQTDMATRHAAATRALLQEASEADLTAGTWDERRFGIRQASMTRDAVNHLLAEVARAHGRVFAAESFDISVKDPRESLFHPPDQPLTELLISLRGSLLSRTATPNP